MAHVTKKRKTNHAVEKFHCFSCATDRTAKQFPDYNPSPDCEHLINICKTCLKKWVESNVESATFATGGEEEKVFGVKCPQCDGIMRNVNLEIAATKKVYERFEELERKHIGDTTPGWRWCMSPTCRSGQVHEKKAQEEGQPKRQKRRGPVKRVEREPAPESDIYICNECGAKACVTCDRPWHEGESCADYQARIKDRVEEEDKALMKIQAVTKSCPNCKKRIEKNGGCPMMYCTQCSSYFCWRCEEPVKNGYCKCNGHTA